MKALEIKKGIYWVGAIDWNLREFHGYLTQKGSTYNAYLIVDEKIVLVDTVKSDYANEMLERISSVIDPSKIDIVISNHTEMDHSGSIPFIMEKCKNATVVASPNGVKELKQHFDANWKMRAVETNEEINIGENTLKFVLMQMVHWPDSMATYIENKKLLMPNDMFGQHISSFERFEDEYGLDIVFDEAKKYYANILYLYANQVQKALKEIDSLDIDMIAPSHGLIWQKNVKGILEKYHKWSSNCHEERAVIVFDSMWGSTEKMAKEIYRAFEARGIKVDYLHLKHNHISDIMTKVLEAKYICLGSPTLNGAVLPTMASFLSYMTHLRPKNKIALPFGSYGWGHQSIMQMEKILTDSGFQMMESVKFQYVPKKDALKEIQNQVSKQIATLLG